MKVFHFSQELSTVVQKVEQATAEYSMKFYINDKLSTSALVTPSLNHIMTDDVVFEHIYLRLILADFLCSNEEKHLKARSKLFHQFPHNVALHEAWDHSQIILTRRTLRLVTVCARGAQTTVHIPLYRTPHAHAFYHPFAIRKLHRHM